MKKKVNRLVADAIDRDNSQSHDDAIHCLKTALKLLEEDFMCYHEQELPIQHIQ